MRWYWNFLGIFAVAGVAALAAPTHASAAVFDCTSQGVHTKTNFVENVQTTTSQTFVNVPGANVIFPADGSTCVIVEISTQVRAAQPRALQMRVTLDASAVIQPNFISLYTVDNVFDERAAIFVLRNVSPGGSRTLRVQFLSTNGSPVSLSKILITTRSDSD